MHHRFLPLALVALPLFLAACAEPEDTRPGQPVAHRRQAFHDILKAFEPIGKSLKAKPYAADDIAKKAARLDSLKDGPWTYFPPDSNYPPSHSTDKVWSDAAGFERLRDDFIRATGQLATAAAAKDEAAVRTNYEKLHQVCRDCHRDYRK